MAKALRKSIGIAIAVFVLAPLLSRAAEEIGPPGWYNAEDVRWTIEHLAILDGQTATSVAPSNQCVSAYNRLYPSGKDSLEFRIFIGYWDTQPEPGAPRKDVVIDGFVKNLFSQILLKPCTRGLFACGFSVEAEPSEQVQLLSKEIAGPDGKPRTIHLTLESSSITDSNRENRHEYGSQQKAQSTKIEDDFLSSLGTSDVVLYTGHSRWGTGPGYKPLPVVSWSIIDAALFKPSLHQFEKELKTSNEPPKVLGIFSCQSEKYYSKPLETDSPDSALALTTDVPSDMQAHEATLGTLNALLGLQCEEDFKKALPVAEILDFFKP